MLIRPAEESFKRGMHSLRTGRKREAMAFFEAALELEKRYNVDRHQGRYLSYYGLCLVDADDRVHEAIQLCRMSTRLEEFNPDLRFNLASVLLRAGLRREAHGALNDGLRLHPGHPRIDELLSQMGRRRRPPLPFLARSHPINVVLGRMRNRS